VRMRAAYALGLVLPDSLFPLVQRILREDNQLVRNSFVNGIKQGRDTLKASFLMNLIDNSPGERPRRALAALAASAVFVPEDSVQYNSFILSQTAPIRRALYQAMSRATNDTWIKTAGLYRNNEQDEELRAMLPTVQPPMKGSEKEEPAKKKRGRKKRK